MLTNLDKLRRAPRKVKDHFIAVVTISVMALITLIWFIFTLNSFFHPRPTKPKAATPVQTETAASTTIQAPF